MLRLSFKNEAYLVGKIASTGLYKRLLDMFETRTIILRKLSKAEIEIRLDKQAIGPTTQPHYFLNIFTEPLKTSLSLLRTFF